MDELRLPAWIKRIHRDDAVPIASLTVAIKNLQKGVQQIAIVLLGKTQFLAGIIELQQKLFIDGGHVHDTDEIILRIRCQSFVYPAVAADYDRVAILKDMASAELERIVLAVDHG